MDLLSSSLWEQVFLPWGFGENSDDLDFIDEMIVWAKANYNIRETHIFTTGHSYGAMFSYAAARWSW